MKHLIFIFIGVAAVCCGCGGNDASTGDDDGSGSATGDLLGTFSVELVAPKLENDGSTTAGYTSVLGKVYDGTVPDTVIASPRPNPFLAFLAVEADERSKRLFYPPLGETTTAVLDLDDEPLSLEGIRASSSS